MSRTGYSVLADVTDFSARAQETLDQFQSPILLPTIVDKLPSQWRRLMPNEDKQRFRNRDKFRFTFPREGYVDPSTVRLTFTARFYHAPGVSSGVSVCYDISTIFRRIVLYYGHVEIDAIENYNLLARILNATLDDPNMSFYQRGLFEGKGRVAGNTGGLNGRTSYHNTLYTTATATEGGTVPRQYIMSLLLGLFCQKRYIPVKWMNELLSIEFLLDDIQRMVMEGNASAVFGAEASSSTVDVPPFATVEVCNPRLIYRTTELSETLDSAFASNLLRNQVQFQHLAWDFVSFPVKSTVPYLPKYSFDIPIKRSTLFTVLAVLRTEADETNFTFDPFATYASVNPTKTGSDANTASIWKDAIVKQYQWHYCDQKYPENPIPVLGYYHQTYGGSFMQNKGTYPDRLPFATPAVEAWFHMEQALLSNKRTALESANAAGDVPLSIIDPFEQATKDFTTGTWHSNGASTRQPCTFAFVGHFSTTMPNGQLACVGGGKQNEKLNITFEVNGNGVQPGYGISNPATAPLTPGMKLDVFICYNKVLNLRNDGMDVLD